MKRFRNRNLSGFTMVEIVMVIALIALAATLVVVNVDTLFDNADTVPTEELLFLAVREARYRAALEKETVYLRYDIPSVSFEITRENGAVLAQIPTDHNLRDDPLEVVFFTVLPGQGRSTTSYLNYEPELSPMSRVPFSPLLVSPHFIAQLNFRGIAPAFRFDPFSSVQFPVEIE